MPITTSENDIKERLSIAYVTAIAARAGCQIATLDIDKSSIDAIVCPIAGAKSHVNLQLKSTTESLASEGLVRVALPIKNYNDLRDMTSNVPHYLVILQLPTNPAEWLTATPDQLVMHGKAYFGNFFGQPSVPNTATRTVVLPQSQRFDVATLERMILTAPERIGTSGDQDADRPL